MNKETAYWMALAHELPAWSFASKEDWKNEDKMNLIIRFYHDKKMSIEVFFGLSEETWETDFLLNNKQINDLLKVKSSLANYAFLAENLQNNGIEVIPVVSPEYSKTLKENLKKSAPVVLYIKGNKQIMQKDTVAIVGSRDASQIALDFTDNVARRAGKERKAVVSGFAKGVDKQALDSSIACNGQSIIVLPQGIMTFESGFKTYYKEIIKGDVLVLSIFHPKAPWGKDLAMARNPIIYGLAKEIYVAEAKPSKNRQGKETKGGTWAGVIDGLNKIQKGLRQKNTVFVRKPETSEKNDNLILIQKGAVAVDFDGLPIKDYKIQDEQLLIASEQAETRNLFAENVKEILSTRQLSANDILKKLNLDWKSDKLTKELKKLDFIEITKVKNKNYFTFKSIKKNLFSN
jgi:predicted Rossmann fold nucleotide-binding protein DprA/Smf involved in DNA uptake